MAALNHFCLFILTVAFASFLYLSAVNGQHSPEMESVINATNAMSSSGYITMSAINTKLHKSLFHWTKLNLTGFTIFAPIESAFTCNNVSGKREAPSFETVLHYSPVYLPYRTLCFLTEIPTIFVNKYLVVTSEILDSEISIGFVKISVPPIYDDGYVIIYSVDQVFDISFTKDKKVVHKKSSSNGSITRDPEL
ncbi:putative fasciclin-like arabinogalactan protein 20 [Lycium ferocissimum]|uniref:putative fasciclin-like arabinogalactan protein 20 n=1 Tax=Lycium ferocissimum TaxID=112874 RepID=UPI0028156381|nr:putative fasciclin-like arabinogalactan protein 20 [Lycium ferocissimum]